MTNEYRYAVIGAGIVGLATAYHLQAADPSASVVVIEAEDAVGMHQTGHNSGVIHSGIYYEPGSLKARFCKAGERDTKEFCRRHGVRFAECGKLIVATNPVEVARMDGLQQRAEVNGIAFWRLGPLPTGRTRTQRYRPWQPCTFRRPESSTIRTSPVPWPTSSSAPAGNLRTGSPVVGIIETAEHVVVTTERESVSCDRLIVCGGLQSDRLAELAGLAIDVQIVPFRGEYYRLPATRSGFVQRLIYPVPDPELPFLGVHLSPTIHGDITVGPNAVLGLSRQGLSAILGERPRRRPDGDIPR